MIRIVLLLSILNSQARASEYFMPEMPPDLDRVDVHLVTVGNGPELFMRYGHTFLRVVDRYRGQEMNFNWGIFDFSDPNFGVNFFRGILRYRMGTQSTRQVIRLYREIEKRSVWLNEIHLTNAQKRKLMEQIVEFAQPENRFYNYHYFFHNCATIPLNMLDRALFGKIKEKFAKEPAQKNFRTYVRENLNRPPPVAFFLDIVMNNGLELPISKWEEMFLPIRIKEYLSTMPRFDDEGNPLPGTRLLGEEKTVLEYSDYPSSSINGTKGLGIIVGVLTLLSLLLIRVGVGKAQVLGIRLFGFVFAFWQFIFGFIGIVMMMSWIISEHQHLHHNANLWVFWPIDWLLLPLGVWWLWKGTLVRPGQKLDKILIFGGCGHLMSFIVFFGLYLGGVINQGVDLVIGYLGPCMVALFGGAFLLRQKEATFE